MTSRSITHKRAPLTSANKLAELFKLFSQDGKIGKSEFSAIAVFFQKLPAKEQLGAKGTLIAIYQHGKFEGKHKSELKSVLVRMGFTADDIKAPRPAPRVTNAKGAPMTPSQQIEEMVKLFSRGKIDNAEADALGAYYQTLAPSDRAAVKQQMVGIYQASRFQGESKEGMASWFLDITASELSGRGAGTPFHKLLKEDQLLRLQNLEALVGDANGELRIRPADVDRDTRAKIEVSVKKAVKDDIAFEIKENYDGDDSTKVGTPPWRWSSLSEKGVDGTAQLRGYKVDVSLDYPGYSGGLILLFNFKGTKLGVEGSGE